MEAKRELEVDCSKKQNEKFKEGGNTKREVALMQERKRVSLLEQLKVTPRSFHQCRRGAIISGEPND